jgi:hypothetical protein
MRLCHHNKMHKSGWIYHGFAVEGRSHYGKIEHRFAEEWVKGDRCCLLPRLLRPSYRQSSLSCPESWLERYL